MNTRDEQTDKLLQRKLTRLRGYDYSTPGYYFITICTKDRKQILSKIVVGDGVLDVPRNILSECGKIVDERINQMDAFYSYINIEKYVIMPNHIHFILSIPENGKFYENGTSRTPSPTNSIVAGFVSTLKRFCNLESGMKIWQRSYHDHIIRGEKDYRKIWEYIDTNTERWEDDCFYSGETEL